MRSCLITYRKGKEHSMHNTGPGARDAFIGSLPALADYLAERPGVPVPLYGTRINLIVDGADHGGREQVDAAAALMDTPVTDETSKDGHYTTEKIFGDITYCVVAIPDAARARYQANDSYWGCVTPDGVTSDA
jgi:hypothetical protein